MATIHCVKCNKPIEVGQNIADEFGDLCYCDDCPFDEPPCETCGKDTCNGECCNCEYCVERRLNQTK
jgi:hypothetical protein